MHQIDDNKETHIYFEFNEAGKHEAKRTAFIQNSLVFRTTLKNGEYAWSVRQGVNTLNS